MRVEVLVLFIHCCIPSAQNSACDLIHTLQILVEFSER